MIDSAAVGGGFPTGKRCIFLVRVRPSWDEVSLCSVVSSMHLLTAGAVSGGHLVCVAVGVLARLGARRERRARCDSGVDPLRSSVDGSLGSAALF